MKKIHVILVLNKEYLQKYINFLDEKFIEFEKHINFNKRVLFYLKGNYDLIKKSNYLKEIKEIYEIENLKDFFLKLKEHFELNNYNENDLDTTFLFINNYEDIFLDFELNEKILKESIEYDIEYYYGEGFADGIVGQVLKANVLLSIISLVKNTDKFDKNFIFKILLRNISYFDIDLIEGEEEDEIFRISLKLNKKEDLGTVDYILEEMKKNINTYNKKSFAKDALSEKKIYYIKYKEIVSIIKKFPILLRTYPKTIFLEISSEYYSDLIYYPDKNKLKRDKKFLSLNDIENIYNNNKYFFKDTIIILDGFGEPFANNQIIEIVNFLSEKNEVVIKTSGAFFNSDFTKKFNYFKNVKIIIIIDASNENVYKIVGHKENFKKIETFTKYFLERYPENFYIEFTRMDLNDIDIETFYEKWKKFEDNIIFRKYNNLSNFLKDREVADLTPVKRFPCFHLRRDFYILSDGKASICKSDFNGEILKVNVLDKSCYEIFRSYDEIYTNHINKTYPELCKRCNEFYTFNF